MTVLNPAPMFRVAPTGAATARHCAAMAGIEKVSTFMQLSERGRELLTRGIVTYTFPEGKTIIDKGQEVSGAYFVLEGRLRVFTYAPSGKEATLYIIDPGGTCILALNSLFNRLAYPAWVETEAPTSVALVPGPLFRTLFETEKPVQDLTVHTLSTLVFRLMAELEQVHSCTLEQRLAGFLAANARGDGLLRKTQAEIAGHLGTTREVVARLMGRLTAQGLVDTGRGEVRILNPDALADFARVQEST